MTATSTAPAAAVMAGRGLAESGYEERAAAYAAEIASLAPPRLLDGLLHPGTTVAEMPSGTGHFLRAYAAAGARTVLAPGARSRGQHLLRRLDQTVALLGHGSGAVLPVPVEQHLLVGAGADRHAQPGDVGGSSVAGDTSGGRAASAEADGGLAVGGDSGASSG